VAAVYRDSHYKRQNKMNTCGFNLVFFLFIFRNHRHRHRHRHRHNLISLFAAIRKKNKKLRELAIYVSKNNKNNNKQRG
jgi:hypothetical protein